MRKYDFSKLTNMLNEIRHANLKRCPFCGCASIHNGYNALTDLFYRQCMDCLAQIDGFKTAIEADNAWNLRTDPNSDENAETSAQVREANQF